MKPISDWPVFVQIGAAAAILGSLVTITTNFNALAEMQPLATKHYVMAQNALALDALTEKLSLIADGINDVRWDQTVYRQKALADSLPRMVTAIAAAEDFIQRNPDDPDIVARVAELRNLMDSYAKNKAEFDLLTCRIEQRDRTGSAAAC